MATSPGPCGPQGLCVTIFSKWLNSLASDLDLMLNDICRGSFPYSTPSRPHITAPQQTRRTCPRLGEDPILEQYMTSAAALVDDDEYASSSEEAFGERTESEPSSDGEFFSVDEDAISSEGTRIGSDLDSPIPFYNVKNTPSTKAAAATSSSQPHPAPHPPRHVLPAGQGTATQWEQNASQGAVSTGQRTDQSPSTNPRGPLTLSDRVRHTHPLWYLPNIQRKSACQQLFDKEQGTFLVRQASEPGRMVLSIRTGNKPSIEHFLIENAGSGLKLKGCFRSFEDISKLITHYCQSQDGLPVQLLLPHIIMQANTHQELTSLALLGQDFWTAAIARPPPILRSVFHTTVSAYETDTHQRSAQNNPATHQGEPCVRRNSSKCSSKAKSLHASSFEKCKAKKLSTVTNQSTTQSNNLTNGANLVNGSEYNGATLIRNDYSSTSLTNHCRERSAFHTPPVRNGELPTDGAFNNSDVTDKLSDYEDAQGPFFQPISNLQSDTSSNIGDKLSQISSQYENVNYNAMLNHGYMSDCLSEKSDYIDSAFFIDLDDNQGKGRKRLISTDHVEETRTVCLKQVVPKSAASQSHTTVFTFNVVPSTPTEQTVSPGLCSMLSVPTPPYRAPGVSAPSSQFSTPSYMEPADTLIGRVAGASHTTPVVRVNNTLKQTNQHHTNSLELKPSATNPGQCHHGNSLDVKPPPGPHKVEVRLDKSSTMPKLRHEHRLVARSPQNNGLHQRRRDNTSSLIRHLEVIKKPPPRVFLRSQSMRCLPSNGEQGHLYRAHSLPREVKGHDPRPRGHDVKGSLQTVMEPSSQSPSESSSYKVNGKTSPQLMVNGLANGHCSGDRSNADKQEINNHLNEILGDLDELNLLIEDTTPPPVPLSATLRRFPRAQSQSSLNSNQTSFSDTCTVEDVLNNISPDLTLRPIKPLTAKNLQRRSDYDNLDNVWRASSRRTIASSVCTRYSQPWDSNILHDLITFGSVAQQQGKFPTSTDKVNRDSFASRQSGVTDYSMFNESESGRAPSELSFELAPDGANPPTDAAILVELSDDEDEGVEDDHNVGAVPLQRVMEPIIAPSHSGGVGTKSRINLRGVTVRNYVSDLAQNCQTTFGKTVDNFICCTKEGTESNPHIVIRNVRQFMNGIKNYLVQNGEEALNEIIEAERKQLEQNEFLNIDALIEGALHKCVVKPLERHILSLFVEDYKDNGSLKNMKENIEYARTKSPYELGIKPGLLPPEGRPLEKIKQSLHKMQKAYSPIIKLQHLLGATSAIYNLIQEIEDNETASSTNSTVSLGADDFLPMFIYVLVQCGMVSAEIEVDYMWGLLHPYILAGEGGYHLTTLSSAVHVLKNLKITMESTNDCPRLPSLGDLQGFMKIIIPDEKNHSIITKILPVRPNMTTKDVVNMIAHRFKFTNPQDYGLYILISGLGSEERVQDADCPQTIKESILRDGRECVFAYKRNNAKFVWPIIFKS